MDWLGLTDKAVIVTGGASGIGKAVCQEFAACGASVVIADVSQEAGEQVCAELTEASGREHRFVLANVTDKIHSILSVTRLCIVFSTFGSVNDAVTCLRQQEFAPEAEQILL